MTYVNENAKFNKIDVSSKRDGLDKVKSIMNRSCYNLANLPDSKSTISLIDQVNNDRQINNQPKSALGLRGAKSQQKILRQKVGASTNNLASGGNIRDSHKSQVNVAYGNQQTTIRRSQSNSPEHQNQNPINLLT